MRIAHVLSSILPENFGRNLKEFSRLLSAVHRLMTDRRRQMLWLVCGKAMIV
jgi:hypothetical protein